ncbi:MAG: hypothetical protein H6718_20015 [Polyangiaceae bacterium]|nr:hypothetical protein [Myxococcales bacterium]MCB9587699.1 hypothetical protein [Polyangiaceae bacterium]MCB9605503.1 hypothetical protein [Polyangiaceae bacterium]
MQRLPFLLFRTVFVLGAVSLLASACSSDGNAGGGASANTDLDCSSQSHVSAGQLEGHDLRGEAGLLQGRAGDNWYLQGVVDDFYFTAARTPSEDVGVGRAHFTSETSAEQICVAKAEWVDPAELLQAGGSALLFSGFSTLGSCADVQGPTQKLNFCYSYSATGTANCDSYEARVFGELSGTPIDERRPWLGARQHVSEIPESLDTDFEGGGRLEYAQQSDGSYSGSLRLELNGAMRVYCVKGVTGAAPADAEQQELTLDVVELGSCPGTPLAGEISACLY